MFILGSGSARRKELLAQLGIVPDAIRAPDIDEEPHKGELPRPYCTRMAREKVEAVAASNDDIVLCADTTVSLGRRILGKPENAIEARRFLALMSGRRHRVITAIAVRQAEKRWVKDVVSLVRMKPLYRSEIDGYIDSGDWHG